MKISEFRQLSPLSRKQPPGEFKPPAADAPADQVSWSGRAKVGGAIMLGLAVAGAVGGVVMTSPPPQALVQVKAPPSQTYITTADEVELGKQVAQELEKQMPVWNNPAAQARLDRIGARLAEASTRKDIEYNFKLLDSPTINAMAIPGGTIYATRGLLEKFSDDGELAFVVGHEVGHVEQRHSMQKLTQTLLRKVVTLPLSFRQWPISRAAVDAGDQLIGNRYGQAAETEADRLGQQRLVQLGISPYKAVSAMERLKGLHADGKDIPVKLEQIFSDHPPTQQRIETLRTWAAEY